ncbi:hypothetical protein JX265_001821 [Neoarthrinium moseri]|uniref:GST N-terminal domain-containing protein n=1 Tax=Neoarthrinium moseri TaxID=1658444 RepID=A0A9P9WW54_9PEZI|nr:uncharacterized protein JN550_005400 [Neoarthrinium moseri]KAI1870472.1 hypothetical protein JN550_005400 [Neoarthrinium moseri]KAI1880200.1 hypothetical protein JX265_001821 [Neoarthrinium moseri]
MIGLHNAEYTLYSSPFSLYSMMARHTVQLGPTTYGAKPPQKITLGFVNHGKNENLRESYLKVNPKGQVPAMTGNVLERALTDSHSISLYLAEKHYPAMLPPQHETIIRDLLKRIHAIYGLSFNKKKPTPEMMQHNPSPAEDILRRTDISPEYRKALEVKLTFHNENNGVAFQPAIVAKAYTDLRAIFTEITEHRKQSGVSNDADWTFGAEVGPTVLDSHLLPLVLRCIEVGNDELIPQELQRWAEIKVKGPVWQKVMHGRPTRWDPSMGPVEEMQDMMSF